MQDTTMHGIIYVVSILELFYMACMLEAGLDITSMDVTMMLIEVEQNLLRTVCIMWFVMK